MNLSPRASTRLVSEAAATFQFRKCFPSTFDRVSTWEKYRDKLSQPSPPPTRSYERALRSAIDVLPPDWDRGYSRHVSMVTPTYKANLEGLLPYELPLVGFTADAFRDACLGSGPCHPINPEKRVKVLDDCGKPRIVTIASIAQLQLAPLHRTIYDALVKTGAVLRGPPNGANMSSFKTRTDRVFVSGDYEAATDGFNLNNSVLALSLLRHTSTRIPQSIWDLAIEFMSSSTLTFQANLDSEVDSVEQRSGQLMGNYLSFPLLCLTNLAGVFLAFGRKRTRSIIRDGLLRINGDDIVFQSTLQEYRKWVKACPEAGLNVSTQKTLVHERVFTINSNFFCGRSQRRPRHVWFHRAKSWIIDPTSGGRKPRGRRETAMARFDIVNDVLKEQITGISCPEKRSKMRFLYQKVHRSVCEGSSLRTQTWESERNSAFTPSWRLRARAAIKMRGLDPRQPPGVVMAPVEGIQKSRFAPRGISLGWHLQISQYLSWGREKVDEQDWSLTFCSSRWNKPPKPEGSRLSLSDWCLTVVQNRRKKRRLRDQPCSFHVRRTGYCVCLPDADPVRLSQVPDWSSPPGRNADRSSRANFLGSRVWGSFVVPRSCTWGEGLGFNRQEVKWYWPASCSEGRRLAF